MNKLINLFKKPERDKQRQVSGILVKFAFEGKINDVNDV